MRPKSLKEALELVQAGEDDRIALDEFLDEFYMAIQRLPGQPEPQGMTEMQYLVSVIDNSRPAAGGSANADEEAALDAFNERLQAEGHWVFAGGLGAPSTATVIDNRNGAGLVTDGPFVESKEYLGGFWVIEAPDLDVALKLATEGSKACNRKVEVRPFL